MKFTRTYVVAIDVTLTTTVASVYELRLASEGSAAQKLTEEDKSISGRSVGHETAHGLYLRFGSCQ